MEKDKDTDKEKREIFDKNQYGARSVKQAPLSGYHMHEEDLPDYDFFVSRRKSGGKRQAAADSSWLSQLNKSLNAKPVKAKAKAKNKSQARKQPSPQYAYNSGDNYKNKYNSRKNFNGSHLQMQTARRRRKLRKGPVAVLAVALVAVVLIIIGVCKGFSPYDSAEFAEKYAGLQPLNLPTYGERFWNDRLYIGEDVIAGGDKPVVMPREEYEAYCMQMGGEDAVNKIAYLRSVAKGEVNVSYLRNWSVFSAKTGKKLIALSFDDGPNAKTIDQYLAILKKYDAHATFFMVGQSMQKYPEAVQKIVESGNEPASHTWSHKNFKKCSAQVISDDLNKSAAIFKELVGYDLYLMRCPYGNITDDVRTLNKKMGVISVMWNVDTLDWKKKNAAGIVNSVKNHTDDGNIILMHEGKSLDLQALPAILAHLKNSGYQVVSVGELLWQAHLNGMDGTNGQ